MAYLFGLPLLYVFLDPISITEQKTQTRAFSWSTHENQNWRVKTVSETGGQETDQVEEQDG